MCSRLSGNTSRMLSASEQACHLADELAQAHPEIPRYRHNLAANLRAHSNRQLAAKLPAHAALDRSASLYEDLVRSYPGVDQYRFDLLRVRLQQVFLARAAGDHAAADAAARGAVNRCDPADPKPRRCRRTARARCPLSSSSCHGVTRLPTPRGGRARDPDGRVLHRPDQDCRSCRPV